LDQSAIRLDITWSLTYSSSRERGKMRDKYRWLYTNQRYTEKLFCVNNKCVLFFLLLFLCIFCVWSGWQIFFLVFNTVHYSRTGCNYAFRPAVRHCQTWLEKSNSCLPNNTHNLFSLSSKSHIKYLNSYIKILFLTRRGF